LEILLEDGPLLAVNKPPGLLTQGVPAGIPTLESQVREYIRTRYGKPGNVYLGIPHRLDRPVSGVMVFAKNSKAASRLAEQFRDRVVRKVYWAVVTDNLREREGTFVDWLLKDPAAAHVRVVDAETPGAKRAELTYRTLSTTEAGSLVEIELHTGRMHQIRVQFGSRGCPVLGDVQYGATAALDLTCSNIATGSNIASPVSRGDVSPTEPPRSPIIALHSRLLELKHPVRYDPVTITAPAPMFWSGLIPKEG
jgi:23S rRNA pseudouridine1911/1915/1917 synthase